MLVFSALVPLVLGLLLIPVPAAAQATDRVAVMPIVFQGVAEPTTSIAAIRDQAFGPVDSLKAFWEEVSYGKIVMTGDVYGYLHLPIAAPTSCSPASDGSWLSLAEAAAAALGYRPANYNRRIYVFMGVVCGSSHAAPNYGVLMAGFGGGTTWHEFGHMIGLSHPVLATCTVNGQPSTFGVDLTPANAGTPGKCSATEYGDPFSVMGLRLPGHVSSAAKDSLGWFKPGMLQSVSQSGDYQIAPLADRKSALPRALVVLPTPLTTPVNGYYVEYRRPIGYDRAAPGVLVYTRGEELPYLGSAPAIYDGDLSDTSVYGLAFPVGVTVRHPTLGFSITVLSMTEARATIRVTVGADPSAAAPRPPGTGRP